MVARTDARAKVPAGTRKRKRRIRSPHPGVVLLRPDPKTTSHGHRSWRARWTDPDTQRLVKVTLDPEAIRTEEARRDWAVAKSKAIAKRRMALEAGAPQATGTALADALDANELPPFEVLAPYFGPGGGILYDTDTGYHAIGFTLRNEPAK